MTSVNTPLSWKTTLLFVTLATLFILLIGWLAIWGALPIKMSIEYTDLEFEFIQFWILLAFLSGMLLPFIGFFVFLRVPEARKVFGFYFLVLIIQIISEIIFSIILFPSIVVLVGTIYSTYRLWQLWQAKQLIVRTSRLGVVRRRLLGGLLWLLLFFWLSNLIVLLVLPWQIIL